MRVVVVGAGSVGANIASRLADDGQDVTVLDIGPGTTGTSISWLSRFPQVAAADAAELDVRLSVSRAYTQLEADIGGGWMHWADTLTWAAEPAVRARLHSDWKACVERGVPVDLLPAAEARAREPVLAVPEGADVYVEHGGGWVDAALLVETLLAAAARQGASILRQTRVVAIESHAGHVAGVTTEAGLKIAADVVVNAAGSWASHIGALVGCPVPLDLRPGLVVYSRPLSGGPLRHVLNTPLMNIRPEPGGGVAIHGRAESTYGHHSRNAAHAADVLAAAARWLPALLGTTPLDTRVGIRPVPPGGPVIGFHPSVDGLYVAVSHGGIGWGPLWGKFAASEISGTVVPELSRWRPDRFLAPAADLVEGEFACA